jgi:oligopeptidase B
VRFRTCFSLALLLAFVTSGAQPVPLPSRGDDKTEPSASKIPHKRLLHGNTFIDNYFWLRNKGRQDVTDYLESENTYANSFLDPLKPAQEEIYKEFVGRIQETDLEVPQFDRGYWYYSRTVKGKQYPIFCRKKGRLEAPEQIILDMNELAEGKKFLGLGAFEISPNGNLLAYAVDETGYRQYELYFKDLTTGKVLPDRFGKVVGVNWAADNKTVFCLLENAAKRPHQLLRRVLGTPKADLVYQERNPLFNLGAYESLDHEYLFIDSESSETSEVRTIKLDRPTSTPKVIRQRTPDHQYYPEHRNGYFYIRTNFKAKEFRIVKTPVSNTATTKWVDVIPEQKDGTITNSRPQIGRTARCQVPRDELLCVSQR